MMMMLIVELITKEGGSRNGKRRKWDHQRENRAILGMLIVRKMMRLWVSKERIAVGSDWVRWAGEALYLLVTGVLCHVRLFHVVIGWVGILGRSQLLVGMLEPMLSYNLFSDWWKINYVLEPQARLNVVREEGLLSLSSFWILHPSIVFAIFCWNLLKVKVKEEDNAFG